MNPTEEKEKKKQSSSSAQNRKKISLIEKTQSNFPEFKTY